MGIGNTIKLKRVEANLTQKELAEKLHISFQAVSKWENNEAEPSFDTIKEMAKLFNCSIDELFGVEKEKKEEPKVETVKIVEKVIVEKPAKQMLALCENCNKQIYDKNDLFRYNYRVGHRVGRSTKYQDMSKILCKKCNDARLAEEARIAAEQERKRKEGIKKKRIKSFVYPALLFIALLAISIGIYVSGDAKTGTFTLVLAFLGYFFLATMILNNTFVTDVWLEIGSWGFVTMPGVIMEFSLEGILIGIVIKIILWLFGIFLALLAMAAATVVCMFLSIFVYPVALNRNFKYIK